MSPYKYYVYSELELCFQDQMKVCEGLGLSLQDFYMFCIQMLMKCFEKIKIVSYGSEGW